MRIGTATVLLILVLVPVGDAAAQFHAEFAGGLAVPTSRLSEFYDTGYSVSGTLLYDVMPFVGVGINAGYSKVSLDEASVREHVGVPSYELIDGGGVSITNLCAEIRLQHRMPNGLSLWAVGGGGLYKVSIEDREESMDGSVMEYIFPSENQTGGFAGAGIGIPVAPKVEVGAEVNAQFFPLEHELRRGRVEDGRTLIGIRAIVRVAL